MAHLPDWQSLDGGVTLPGDAVPGRVVAVIASGKAVASGWAGAAMIQLARQWSASGFKVIVADGALNYPTLHSLVGVENGEGLSDAALFGASVRRVACPVDGGAFYLITAGTAVANANSVPADPRWKRLLDGFREAGVKLLLFVRDGDSGCAAFLGTVTDIVVLQERGERPPAAIRPFERLVRAVAGPGVAAGGGGAEVRPPEEWSAASVEGRGRVRVIGLVAVGAVVVIAAIIVLALL